MTDVSVGHVLALAKLQRKLLKGGRISATSPADLSALGPLAAVVADGPEWRAGATAHARDALRRVVDSWLASHGDDDEPRDTEPPRVVAATVRKVWGIDSPPAPIDTALAAVAPESTAFGATARRWPRRVAGVAPRVNFDLLAPSRPIPSSFTAGPPSWASYPSRLPPAGRDDELGDRDRLVEMLRAAVGDKVLRQYDDREVVQAIRRLTIRALRSEGYMAAPESAIDNTVNRGILDAWDDENIVTLGTPTGAGVGERASRQAGAIVQMFAFDAVRKASPEAVRSALHEGRRPLAFIREANAARHRERKAIADYARGLPRSPTDGPLFTPPPAIIEAVLNPGVLEPSDAIRLSNAIRSSPSAGEIEIYVRGRERVLRDTSLTSAFGGQFARRTFALADQGVHLEALNLQHPDLIRRMRRIIDRDPWASYFLLAARNDALDSSKHGRHDLASGEIRSVHEAALRRIQNGSLGDGEEILETMHQIALASTGILLAWTADRLFVREGPDDPLLAELVRALGEWSAVLGEYLEALIGRWTGIPARRHEDQQHIFWRDWIVTTSLNRLRADLMVHTAHHALGSLDLAPTLVDATKIENLHSAYLRVMKLDDLTVRSESSLMMQATWLAMLHDGWLPATRTPTRVHASMDLLDPDRRTIRSDVPLVRMNHSRSAARHIERGDGGDIARSTRRGLVYALLEKRSGSRWSEWYETLQGAGLAPPAETHRPFRVVIKRLYRTTTDSPD